MVINEQLLNSYSKIPFSLMTSCIAELGATGADGRVFLIQMYLTSSLFFAVSVQSLGNQTWHNGLGCLLVQHQGCCQHSEDSMIIIFVLASGSRADGFILIGRDVL